MCVFSLNVCVGCMSQRHDVSLKLARNMWLDPAQVDDNQSLHYLGIANFRQKEDRMALCAYGLTGELLPESSAVGSVVMFAPLPASGGFHTRPAEENFLCTIPVEVCVCHTSFP